MTDETTDKPPDETSGGIPGDTSVEAYEVTIVDETSGEPTGVTIDETSGEPTGEANGEATGEAEGEATGETTDG
jgi:hypothetical protein